MRRRGPVRSVISIRLRPELVEALEETADELLVSRNKLIEIALDEYLARVGDRLVAGASKAQALGLVK